MGCTWGDRKPGENGPAEVDEVGKVTGLPDCEEP